MGDSPVRVHATEKGTVWVGGVEVVFEPGSYLMDDGRWYRQRSDGSLVPYKLQDRLNAPPSMEGETT